MSVGRVLVTDGSTGRSRDAVAAIRGLAAAGYEPVLTVSPGPRRGPLSRYVARRLEVPAHGDPAYAGAVRLAAERDGCLTVIPASEEALVALGTAPDELVDKRRLAEAAGAAGVDAPDTIAFAGAAELHAASHELPYPVVVKPVIRRYNAFRADRPADLAAVADPGPVVVQPFVDAPMRAVAGVMWRGSLVVAVHERWLRIFPWPCGLAAFAETVAPDDVLERGIARLLAGHDGIFVAQYAGDRLIDLNLRAYSTHALGVAAGVNVIGAWCDLLRGEPERTARARPGVRYRWLEGDVRTIVAGVGSGRIAASRAAAMLRPRRGTAHSIESITDPGPLLGRAMYALRRAGSGDQQVRVIEDSST